MKPQLKTFAPYELMIDLRSVLPANQFPKNRDLIHALVTTCSYGNLAHHKVAVRRGDRPGKYKLKTKIQEESL